MSWYKKLLGGLLVATLFLVVVEWGLRLFLGPPKSGVYVYSYAGDPKDWLVEAGTMVRPVYKHQPQAFSVEPRRARVAFLGGSTVHGGTPTVGLHEEFPALVGQGLGMEAVNLARPAIDSHDILKIAEELRAYRFNAWIVYSGHNDFGNIYFFDRFQNWSDQQRVGLQSFMEGLRMYQLLADVHRPVANGRTKGRGMSSFHEGSVSMEQKKVALELYLENVRRLAWLADAADVPLFFVIPTASWIQRPIGSCVQGDAVCSHKAHEQGLRLVRQDPAEGRDLLAQACEWDSVPLRMPPFAQKALEEELKTLGVPYIVPHRDLPRSKSWDLPAESLFFDHVHLSKSGHRSMADLIIKAWKSKIPM